MAQGRLSKEEFDRMLARHRVEIEQAAEALRREFAEFEQRFAQVRAEMEQALSGFDRNDFGAVRRFRERFGSLPNIKRRRRRRPRGFDGGDPVPVYPRPKPTPLTGGAEAPLE